MYQRMVSVIMCVYNEHEAWIKASIESIISQSFIDFEFIIVNDNPNRVLNKQILTDYMNLDDRISIIHNLENIGLTRSLNNAIQQAKGKYILRMDADDISLPERIEKQVVFMEKNPDILASGTWMKFFGKMNKKNTEYRINPTETANFLMIGPALCHPSAIIRIKVFTEYGIKYNESFVFSQDYELFFRISQKGRIANIPELLLLYRTTDQQISNSKNQQQTALAFSLRKEIITDSIGNNLVNEIGLFSQLSSKTILKKIYKLSEIRRKDDLQSCQKFSVLYYVVFMSPRNLTDRIFNLLFLMIHPGLKVGFSTRFYLKALVNQILNNYKSLI